jgi:hypothetical protein
LPATVSTRLKRFFDIGFSVHVDRRFQSAEGLFERLRAVVQPDRPL